MTEQLYPVLLTAEEIGALVDLDYYGGEHILSTWDENEYNPLMNAVRSATKKMKEAMAK